MEHLTNPQDLLGKTVYGSDGDKIGKAGQVYLDDETGRPEWLTVNTGLFGNKETFVPLRDAGARGDDITVPYDKDKVKNAPDVGSEDGHITEQEEGELYRYYGLDYASSGTDVGTQSTTAGTEGIAAGTAGTAGTTSAMPSGAIGGGMQTGAGMPPTAQTDVGERSTTDTSYAGRSETEGRDVSGPTTDDAMTRSEERLQVGTERVEAGRARLRKYVTTEQVQESVPVSKERVRVEREPITEANRGDAMAGPAISEEEHEVTLHEERPVVEKETVPVERVRLTKDTETDQAVVEEEVRQEQIDVRDPQDTTTDRGERR